MTAERKPTFFQELRVNASFALHQAAKYLAETSIRREAKKAPSGLIVRRYPGGLSFSLGKVVDYGGTTALLSKGWLMFPNTEVGDEIIILPDQFFPHLFSVALTST